jgi:hypothetical protein
MLAGELLPSYCHSSAACTISNPLKKSLPLKTIIGLGARPVPLLVVSVFVAVLMSWTSSGAFCACSVKEQHIIKTAAAEKTQARWLGK